MTFDEEYAAKLRRSVREDKARLAALKRLRKQPCNSSVEREDQRREVTTEDIDQLPKAKRRFRV